MFLKTKNGIYNLNTGSLYILDVPKKKYDYDFYGSEVVYNTTGNSQFIETIENGVKNFFKLFGLK